MGWPLPAEGQQVDESVCARAVGASMLCAWPPKQLRDASNGVMLGSSKASEFRAEGGGAPAQLPLRAADVQAAVQPYAVGQPARRAS